MFRHRKVHAKLLKQKSQAWIFKKNKYYKYILKNVYSVHTSASKIPKCTINSLQEIKLNEKSLTTLFHLVRAFDEGDGGSNKHIQNVNSFSDLFYFFFLAARKNFCNFMFMLISWMALSAFYVSTKKFFMTKKIFTLIEIVIFNNKYGFTNWLLFIFLSAVMKSFWKL